MVNEKGIASFCQECGACTHASGCSNGNGYDQIVDLIVEKVKSQMPAASDTDSTLIPVGVSNRHVHLTEATFKTLFGADSRIEKYRDLYQPGEFPSQTNSSPWPVRKCAALSACAYWDRCATTISSRYL
ncbi:MAG: PduL/EutD family phosphate acyltransferase [candidate division KSB1 bacterium]|nr:PduL/EutD family phosphate acyltransferase [candidate division KSB1 bacterium]